MRAGHVVIAAIALALFSGCSLVPRYERPAAPIPNAWPQGEAAGSGTAAADIAWRDFFRDARLAQLIAIALKNNRDLRVAMLNVEQARAQYRIRRADELPTVGVGISGSRQPSTKGDGSITSLYTAGFSVTSYEFDFFGRFHALSEAAQASYLASEEGRKTAQISLVAAVASGYLALLADDELLALTQQTLGTREDSLKLTKLKFDAGAASEIDHAQALSLYEAARATLAQLQRQLAQDQNALVLLLGQPMPAELPTGGSLLQGAAMLSDVPAGLPSELLTRRPDIMQAEQQLVAANANIGAARAAFFPRITLTASVGSASSELSGLFKSGSFAWSVAPQALLTLFDSGRNQAALDSAKVGRDIAVAQYEKAIQSAFREVSDALAGRATLGEQLRAQRAQADAEATRFRLADLRYRSGAASYLDLLDAQRSLFSAQQAAIQVQLAQLQNQVALYKALGGGWRDERTADAGGLVRGLDVRHDDGPVHPVGGEAHLVAGLQRVQHGRILDLEDHGHAGHAEVLDLAVLDRQLLGFLVDLAHFAVGHVGGPGGGGCEQQCSDELLHRAAPLVTVTLPFMPAS
jgi:outer membrane protein, multidrug efflux system